MEYKWIDVTLLLVIDIMWHFEVLKLMPQVLAQSQRLFISLELVMFLFTTYWAIQEAVICEETYLRVDTPGQVVDVE